MSKSERRARKKANRALRPRRPLCDHCRRPALSDNGNHDSAWSVNGSTWDGVAVVAWCPWCGSDTCS